MIRALYRPEAPLKAWPAEQRQEIERLREQIENVE